MDLPPWALGSIGFGKAALGQLLAVGAELDPGSSLCSWSWEGQAPVEAGRDSQALGVGMAVPLGDNHGTIR